MASWVRRTAYVGVLAARRCRGVRAWIPGEVALLSVALAPRGTAAFPLCVN